MLGPRCLVAGPIAGTPFRRHSYYLIWVCPLVDRYILRMAIMLGERVCSPIMPPGGKQRMGAAYRCQMGTRLETCGAEPFIGRPGYGLPLPDVCSRVLPRLGTPDHRRVCVLRPPDVFLEVSCILLMEVWGAHSGVPVSRALCAP